MLNLIFILTILLLSYLLISKDFYYTKIHTIKLEGNSTLMYYYANIYVGSPPKR